MNCNYKVFNISNDINNRISYLESSKLKLENILEKLPEGNLLVSPGNTRNSFRYYNRKSPKDKCGEYLTKKDTKLKTKLATKKYIKIALKNISYEIKILNRVQKMKLSDSLVDTYKELNPGIKKLIEPIAVDDETFVKNWLDIPYEGLGFSENDKTEYFSNRGERMRSKSEVAIANYLIDNGIPYKYECPIIRANGEKFYPDFTILDVKRRRIVYWEHFGRMGDMSYVSKNIWKLDEYKKMGINIGINLYISFESEFAPMGSNEPLKIIKEITRD